MRRIISILLLSCISTLCFGQHPKVRNFDKSTYNAGTQTWCIMQDEGGNMTFANSGILEYDGTEWSITQTVNHTGVRSLYYDQETDRMYYGAANEIGYVHIDSDYHKRYTVMDKDSGVTMEDIWAIHKIGDSFWLRENTQMYRLDSQEIKQYGFKDKISCSAYIDDDFLIFVNNHGVYILNSDKEFTQLGGTESLKSMRVISILPFEGSAMFVCEDGRLFIYKNGALTEIRNSRISETTQATVYCAQTDGRNIALGTVTDGVFILDMKTGRSLHLNTDTGLQNNTVLSMYFDREGNLWLGLDKGIDLVQLSSAEYSLWGNPDKFGAGYASENHDGELWLGTNQGLYHAQIDDSGRIPSDDSFKTVEQAKGQVWDLMVYDDILFCCHDKGVYMIKDGKCSHIDMNGAWKLERLKDWPQYLLGSSYDRMFLLKKSAGRWAFDCWVEGFDDATKAFEEDTDGTIWFSHWIKGLFKLTLDMKTKSISRAEFMSRNNGFPEDWSNIPIQVNNKVIFTTARGFYTYDSYSDRAYPLETMNSLFNTPPQGASAYVTPYGYSYFASSSIQAVTYKDDQGNEVMDSLSLKSLATKRLLGFENIRCLSENQIMVNTDEGFSIVNIDRLKEGAEKPIPAVYIKSIDSETDDALYSSTCPQEDSTVTLRLPFSRNSIKVKAACPVYESGNGMEFSFMLENYDRQWSQFSTNSRKEYTQLPHGEYILRVRAMDNLHSSIRESAINLVIAAPWYYSKLAIIIYILTGIVLGWSIYRLMYMYSLKRARLMSMKKEEELRKKQLKLDLEHKAQDLAESTMNVIRKNEILLEIDSELEQVAENMAEDRNTSLKILGKIRHQIRENIQHDDSWKKFEENFDVVYDDYLKRLSLKYPHLTVADKKMCAYLKMDLCSKEIAPLLNITLRSVEMTRYRLRKKLGLSREDNLTEFLQKF